MEKAVLDLTGCNNHWDMHERFQKDLQLPEHYGKNWDAFWDSMMCDSPVEYVEIRGEHTVSENLLPSLEKLHEILWEVKQRRQKLGWEFDYVIVD
ncbi:MAG: barstar family protein [Ruminiclostridium sp.]|nr:barstar family protein [Ruminiclostridium sp.]